MKMEPMWKTSLKTKRRRMANSFPIRTVIPALSELLTPYEHWRVVYKGSSSDQVDELITILLTKDKSTFDNFCTMLEKEGFQNWATRLRDFKGPGLTNASASRVLTAWTGKMQSECPVLGILVIGETGTGKSTLVNNILGEEVVTVGGSLNSETSTLSKHTCTVEGVPIAVYDTPGLSDSRGSRDDRYLQEMKRILHRGEIHMIIYCVKLTETRVRNSLSYTFKEFNRIGVKWEQTRIALTFADCVTALASRKEREMPDFRMDRYFNNRIAEWRREIPKLLESVGVPTWAAREVKCFPTQDDPEDVLPNKEEWYVPLWLHIFELLSLSAATRMLELTVPRMQSTEIEEAAAQTDSNIRSNKKPMRLNPEHEECLMESFTDKLITFEGRGAHLDIPDAANLASDFATVGVVSNVAAIVKELFLDWRRMMCNCDYS